MTGEIINERNQNQRVVENVVKDSENVISASYSQSLRLQVVLLILFVLFILMLYITFRFKIEFGVGAVLCLFHDVIVMLGYIALFNVEVDYTIIAAILFIMGYSLNDTIVIFDRIRENIEKLKEYHLRDIVSVSINQTLIRSIITSFTTFMAAMALVIWGGPKIAGFSRTIAIGIFFGTYSSIFIAAPIVLLWNMMFKSKKLKEVKVTNLEETLIENKMQNISANNLQNVEEANSQGGNNNPVTSDNSKVQLSKKQLKKLYGGKK
jgi:preprotein translocase SecF subunit